MKNLLIKTIGCSVFLLLSACHQNSSSVSDEEINQASKTQKPNQNDWQILPDTHHQWSILTAKGYTLLPINPDLKIDLFAEDSINESFIYAVRLPEIADNQKSYFQRVGQQINQQNAYSNKNIRQENDQLNYQFTYQNQQNTINENCILNVHQKTPYLACVYSKTQDFNFLKSQIHDFQIPN